MLLPKRNRSSEISPKRLLWIVNHRTLILSEVPAIEALGYEVYVPRSVPSGGDYRSTAIDEREGRCPSLPRHARDLLDSFNFFEEIWSPTIEELINNYFGVVVVSMSIHLIPLAEAARNFRGAVLARAFGREMPFHYADYLDGCGLKTLRTDLLALGSRFGFLHAYDAILEGEDPMLCERGHRVVAPLPDATFEKGGRWKGTDSFVLFHCGSVLVHFDYFQQYRSLKREFGHIPHKIFGPQGYHLGDTAVLPWLPQSELDEFFVKTRAFVYISTEPRHLHFSPIEAMIIGAPVIYLRDSLLSRVVGHDDPGACLNRTDMRVKLERLMDADKDLACSIVSRQKDVPEAFRQSVASREWRGILQKCGLEETG